MPQEYQYHTLVQTKPDALIWAFKNVLKSDKKDGNHEFLNVLNNYVRQINIFLAC